MLVDRNNKIFLLWELTPFLCKLCENIFFCFVHQYGGNANHLYARRVLDIEQGTFTPLIFTSTGGMGNECLQYHCRLAQLISIKKGEHYAKTISWIRARTSFALLRSALICLRGSRARRKAFCDFKNIDIDVETQEGAIM